MLFLTWHCCRPDSCSGNGVTTIMAECHILIKNNPCVWGNFGSLSGSTVRGRCSFLLRLLHFLTPFPAILIIVSSSSSSSCHDLFEHWNHTENLKLHYLRTELQQLRKRFPSQQTHACTCSHTHAPARPHKRPINHTTSKSYETSDAEIKEIKNKSSTSRKSGNDRRDHLKKTDNPKTPAAEIH